METIVNLAGLVAGLVFILLNYKAKGTLLGSFFKKYYQSMLIASLFFFFGLGNRIYAGLKINYF